MALCATFLLICSTLSTLVSFQLHNPFTQWFHYNSISTPNVSLTCWCFSTTSPAHAHAPHNAFTFSLYYLTSSFLFASTVVVLAAPYTSLLPITQL